MKKILIIPVILLAMILSAGLFSCAQKEKAVIPPSITNVLASDIADAILNLAWKTYPTAISWAPEETPAITWMTDKPSTSQVEYGLTINYGSTTLLDENQVIHHKVYLSEFGNDNIYHFRVRSRDNDGNEAVSGDYTYGWCTKLVEVIPRATPYDSLTELIGHIPDRYFEELDAQSLVEWAEQGFEIHSPSEQRKRDFLFYALDFAAALGHHSMFSPFERHIERTIQKIYQQITSPGSADGLTIYRLYNEGTIIKAPNLCFGIDVILWSAPELASSFANILDALFITHRHGDHYDSALIEAMNNLGKPIIEAENASSVKLGGLIGSGTVGDLVWMIFQGSHLDTSFSGFFLFRIGERSILHSGDNTRWIEFAKSEFAQDLDLFLFKPESVYGSTEQFQHFQEALEESLRRLQPKFLVPIHLLELNHDIRALSHDLGIRLYYQSPPGVEVQMLHWGESFVIPDGNS